MSRRCGVLVLRGNRFTDGQGMRPSPFFLLFSSIRFRSKADAPFTHALLGRELPLVLTTITMVGSRDLLARQ